MKTIDTILEDWAKRLKENQPISAGMWVDEASELAILKGDLDNQIAEYEGGLAKVEAEYVKDGKSKAKAETLTKGSNDYTKYLKAKAKAKRIDRVTSLAKARSYIRD